MSIEEIILTLSYFGILILMTSNGIIAFPSSQIIYLAAGYFAFTGDLNLLYVILVGALGHTIGNYILYEISRQKGMNVSKKFISFLFPGIVDIDREIKKVQIAFNKKSIWFLFIGKLVNPIKVFIPIPAGIAKMNRAIYLIIVFITSAMWASLFTFTGYYLGKSYEKFGFLGIGIVLIALICMFLFYKYMNNEKILKELEEMEKEEQKEKTKNKETKTNTKNKKKK